MAFLEKVIRSSEQKSDDLKFVLGLLYELAQSKTQHFDTIIKESLKTAGTDDNRTIAVSAITSSDYDIRAFKSDKPDHIINESKKAVKKIISGGGDNITNGIGQILGNALNALLGSGEGTENESHDYFIAIDGLAIVRLDIMVWIRNITVKGMKSEVESVLAFRAVKSSVDIDKITFGDFLGAYSSQLSKTKIDKNTMLEELEQARKIYDIYSNKPVLKIPPDIYSAKMGAQEALASNTSFFEPQKPSLHNLIRGNVLMTDQPSKKSDKLIMPGNTFNQYF